MKSLKTWDVVENVYKPQHLKTRTLHGSLCLGLVEKCVFDIWVNRPFKQKGLRVCFDLSSVYVCRNGGRMRIAACDRLLWKLPLLPFRPELTAEELSWPPQRTSHNPVTSASSLWASQWPCRQQLRGWQAVIGVGASGVSEAAGCCWSIDRPVWAVEIIVCTLDFVDWERICFSVC